MAYRIRLLILSSLLLTFSLLPKADALDERTLQIPMRDGFELTTDIYLPTKEARHLPCILLRTPYGRDWLKPQIEHLADAGYCVAVQDTRCSVDPEKKTLPYMADGWGELQDGYDTVQWLANSPYTNGRIGTMGESALGITQLLLAPSQPPHLVCQHVGVAASSLYHHAVFPGGQLLDAQVRGWLGTYAKNPQVFETVTSQGQYGPFWHGFDTLAVAERVSVPGLFHSGWYDTFAQGTIDAFVARQQKGIEAAKGGQRLVLGPWPHYWPQSEDFGDFKVPEAGREAPIDYSPKSWFDYHLKGETNGIDTIAPVTYYVMGPFDGSPGGGNFWRTAEHWPPPTKTVPLYLGAGGQLKKHPSVASAQAAVIKIDPEQPVPTLGGRNLSLKAGPVDQSHIEQRKDVLVFTSDVLEHDTEVTGRVLAQIHAAASNEGQGLVLHVCDVYPDGKSVLIVEGAAAVSKKRRTIEVDLWSTSIVFSKGHRIRVTLSGSSVPRYTAPTEAGVLTVWLDGTHGSKIDLPVFQAI